MDHVIIILSGIVQGLGFRPYLFRELKKREITGTIRNAGNLGVVLDLQLPDNILSKDLIMELKQNSPQLARIDKTNVVGMSKNEIQLIDFSTLTIVPSDSSIGAQITLPPDISICDTCLEEYSNSKLPRFYRYDFIACAACGPRYTIMKSLPYDRKNSSMEEFPFCEGCEHDYTTIKNRRFHAQTFSCNHCGPYYFLFSNKIKTPDPFSINEAIKSILDGSILAIKGIGGVNVVCRADQNAVVEKLRNRKRERKYKPFALMVSSIEMARKYVEISPLEEELLTSYRRPIVLCKKKSDSNTNIVGGVDFNSIAPGLPHVGIILPYMGFHHRLFQILGDVPLVFTSGNVSSLPMAISNDNIIKDLEGIADEFLLHNRDIVQRCDDSVVRVVAGYPQFIRRSRGYVPEYISLSFGLKLKSILAVGAELNSTGAISKGEKIFPTQHIGNVRNVETYQFLKTTLAHLQSLLQISDEEITAVVKDLHPNFISGRLADDIVKTKSIQNIHRIQHHHAHLASLMVDHQLGLNEKIVCITIDGVGYGEDGKSWGGEILFGGYKEFTRAGHLIPVPMIGGDLCAKNPFRMLLSVLKHLEIHGNLSFSIEDFISNYDLVRALPQGNLEYKFLSKMSAERISKEPLTSSFGRILDVIAALGSICFKRTYRGEPAMRLEGYLELQYPYTRNKQKENELQKYMRGDTIRSDLILHDAMAQLLKTNFSDLKQVLRGIVEDISILFATSAVNYAKNQHISKIGISGGVAYNELIVSTIKKIVQGEGLIFLQHKDVPCGDAGISVGQIAIAASKLL